MAGTWSLAKRRVTRIFGSFGPRRAASRLDVLSLEDRIVPAVDPNLFQSLRTVVADLNGDGVPDLLAAGNGSATARSGADGKELFTVTPFAGYSGPLSVAVGTVNRDGVPDIAFAAGIGGGPRVQILSGTDRSVLFDRFVYDPEFTGGVSVALGDVTGDGIADLVTSAGYRGGPHLRIFDGASNFATSHSFFAYDTEYRGGVNVAVGDLDGDGVSEIVTGTGPGGGAHVRIFDGRTLKATNAFFSAPTDQLNGTQVGIGDVDGNGLADIVTLSNGRLRAYAGRNPNPFVDIAAGSARTLSVGDLDGDGFGEILASDLTRVVGYGGDPFLPTGFNWTPASNGGFVTARSAPPPSNFSGESLFVGRGRNSTTTLTVDRLRAYTTNGNRIGIFPVDDETGRIGTLNPGDNGWAMVALAGKQELFTDTGPSSNSVVISGDRYLGFYTESGGNTLFSFAQANPSGARQFRFLPYNRFALEEGSQGGDGDFNDSIASISALVTVPPPPPVPTDDGNIPQDLAGITTTITGGETGSVTTAADNTVTLREGDAFRVALAQPFTVPAATSVVRVTYDALNFDTASQGMIRDAFEVAVLSADGTPLALPTAPERDASFNVSEGLAAQAAPGTVSATETVTINLASLPAGTVAQLVMRLVNNDTDNTTSVRIRRIDLYGTNDSAPTGMTVSEQPAGAGPVDFATLSDVTPSVKAEYGRTTLTDERTILTTDLALRNLGTYGITGRVLVAIANLSDPSVGVLNPDGFTPDGLGYYDFTNYIDGSLAAGALSDARTIRFSNPNRERFTYDLQVLAGLNRTPAFTSQPISTTEVGAAYRYAVKAVDPEGQTLTYTLLGGPDGLAIDPATGVVNWSASRGDVGTASVRISAADTLGASVEQSFTITIVADLPNRPPVFTSTPGTEAKVAGAFEVTTLKTGSSPVSIAALGSQIITANTGDANLTIGDNAVSVGEPTPSGLLFRQGYDVDLGLPAFDNPNDQNSIEGLVQGDFNADGRIDILATASKRAVISGVSDTRTSFISVALGSADGGFVAPLISAGPRAFEDNRYSTARHVGDYNGDGKLDVVGVYGHNYDQTTAGAWMLPGNGDGTFGTPIFTDFAGFRLNNTSTADINRDGKLDLVGIEADSQRVRVYFGAGDGSFPTNSEFLNLNGTGSGLYYGVGIGDVDGINGPDVVVPDWQARQIYVFTNDGSGNLGSKLTLPAYAAFYPYGKSTDYVQTVWVDDFDGDAKADILYQASGELGLYRNNGSGTSFTFVDSAKGMLPRGYNIGDNHSATDINGDGKLDVVLGGNHNVGNNTIAVALNKGDGTFDVVSYLTPHTPRANTGGGQYARSFVFTGDYNHDGVTDLLASETWQGGGLSTTFAGAVLIYGDTPGTFASPHSEPGSPNGDFFIASGDVNNDGNSDLLLGATDRWYTRLGNGDGTFGPRFAATQSFYANDAHYGELVDLNHDGKLDLVWGRTHGYQGANGGLVAALGNGDGTFTVTFSEGGPDGSFYGATMIPTADYNNDGYADFASFFGSAYAVGTTIDVYLYDPANPGTFKKSYRYIYPGDANGYNGSAIAGTLTRGDFDGDGNIDLITVARREGPYQHRINFFKGKGDGTFFDPTSKDIFQTNTDPRVIEPSFSANGDVNHDGKLDLVVIGNYSFQAVFLGNGDGTFGIPIQYVESYGFYHDMGIQLVDVDGDGNLDLEQFTYSSVHGTGIRRGHGDGTFGTLEHYFGNSNLGPVRFDDFNNDGVLEFVVPANYNRNEFYPANGPGLTDVATGDFNGDGIADTIASSAINGRVKLLLGNVKGGFDRQFDLLVGLGATGVAAADLDGDGDLDIVTANKAGRSATILINDGKAHFTRQDITTGKLNTAVAAGDLTGDGIADAVIVSASAKTLFLINDGVAIPFALGDTPGTVIVADATGDGINDAIISLPDSKRLMILPGDGNGGFDTPLYVTLAAAAGGVGVADFNGDGVPDMAITLPGLDQAAILFGRGSGRFARPQTINVGSNPTSLSIADMNGDGRPDVLVANEGDDTASVILNRYDPTQLYRYTPTAMDPDGDAVTFDLINAPGGMLFDDASGKIVWAPTADQIGLNSVTITARDGNGGTATQSFNIDVRPNRDNAAPVIFSDGNATLDASKAFSYTPSAVDPDGDALRYRLLSGPAGASVNPTTGEVTWDPRLGALRLNHDRYANSSVITPNSASLDSPSFTVEGWFRIDQQIYNQNIFHKTFAYSGYSGSHSYRLWYLNGSLHATVTAGVQPNGSARELIFRVNWSPNIGQWHHYALTFDDGTGMLSIYADGQLLAQQADPGLHIAYDGNPVQIGYEYSNPFLGAVSQFRIWNVAKTSAQLQADFSREVAADAPNLVLDYRFQDGDAETVQDHSQLANHGRRTGSGYPWPEPTTGLATEQTQYFTLQAEDGKGGATTQSFAVSVVPPAKGILTGTVYSDDDGDGSRDTGEAGIPGSVVYVDTNGNGVRDANEASAFSDQNGVYRLTGLYAGRVHVGVETQAGRTGLYQDVTIPAGVTVSADFAQVPLPGGSIRGSVVFDTNANGVANELNSVYASDFGAAAPNLAPWSINTVSVAPNGTKFLGEFTNESVTLNLAAIPGHSEIHVSFDLYILKSWDGVNGPDRWKFSVDGVNYVDATFSNLSPQQSFPDPTGTASNPQRTGAVANNTLGYTYFGDSTYHFDFTVPHTASTATLTFQGVNLQASSDESWGVNNIVVTAPEPPVAGWPVYLDTNGNTVRDAGESTTTTDANGAFAFSSLSDGVYAVRLDNEAGWSTYAPGSGVRNVSLTGTATGVDFGLVANAEAASRPRFLTMLPDYATARVAYRFENAARDPASRPLTFSLAAAPEGMSINAAGVIVWTPTLGQTGPQTVIVKVANDRGGAALQTTVITVGAPNSDPIITSTPPTQAGIDIPLKYNVIGQDAEEATLAYALPSAPAGAAIDAKGVISWTPAAGQLGVQQFTIEVTDGQGGIASQSFGITVVPGAANANPTFTGAVRTTASVSLPYFSKLAATDADGDALTFALISGPTGMTLDGSMLMWSPTAAQFGTNNVQVSVSDGRGGFDSRDFTIDVRSTLTNRGPSITSTPRNFAVAGKTYRYDIQASDADNDPIVYELVSGPSGLSLDTMRGTVRWVPAADQFGQANVVVRVLDPFGGVAEQSFVISVRAVGGPPAITSVPPVQAAIGRAYLYSVLASDAEADPLTFTLLDAPSGMTINSVTGELQWVPGQIGSVPVVIQVSDGSGGFATQAFAIGVAAGVANQPPTITSLPPLSASAGTGYSYTLAAIDPENTAIRYELRRGPAGMTVNPVTGQVSWLPGATDIGTVIVAFAAIDAGNAAAVQSFELEVLSANIAPQILTGFPTSVPARGTYKYDVAATDANLDPLTYELVGAPAGMTIDAFGRVRWATGIGDLGPHTLTLNVRDPRGGVATQTVSFAVVPDTTAPRVTVIPTQTIVRSNSPEVFATFNLTPSYPSNTVRVSAVDNVGVTGLTVTANGKAVSLDALGLAHFRFEDWGFGGITVIAKASDAAGNVGTGAKAFAFLPFGDDPAVSNFAPPSVVITSPTSSTLGVVQIVGSATSDNFTGYTLSVRRANGISTGNVVAGDFDIPNDYTNVTFTTLATGTSKISNGVLGTWDTTLLENDDYVLRLEETDDVYGTTVYETTIGVRGDFKLGNFRLSFTDITIPVAGIPITLARTYDTLRADLNSEVGYGWRLEFRDTGLRTSLPKTGLEDLGIYSSFKPGTKVYITLPGGTREGFTFTPDIRSLPGFGNNLTIATPRFTSDRGVSDTLSVRGGTYIVNDNGELVSGGGQPYNPAAEEFGGGYTLTRPDGTTYRIDGNSGLLTSAIDRNGNALTFSDDGIRGSGVSITFERDAKGRITRAIDPAGNSVRYAYDVQGNLVRVTDRDGSVTQFTYRTDRPHYLDAVIDPLGRTGIRTEYDANGRLIRAVSSGSVSTVIYDPDHSLQTLRDDLGQLLTLEYDDRGNIIAETDATGSTVRTTYTDSNRPLTITDSLGQTTRFAYDGRDNPILQTNPDQSTVRAVYDARGQVIATIDEAGHRTEFAYDARGNLISIRDDLQGLTRKTYDDRGNLTSVIDSSGRETRYEYDAAGRLTVTRQPDGSARTTAYDSTGNVVRETVTTVLANGSVQSQTRSYTVTAEGRILRQTDPDGTSIAMEYDAAGRSIALIDRSGRRTAMGYDEADRPNSLTYPDGATVRTTYDSAGQVLSQTDALGRVSRYEYDAAGRLTATFAPGETLASSRTEYDSDGRITAKIDARGSRTTYRYDAAGRLIEVIDASGKTTRSSYNADGRISSLTDAAGGVTSFEYDATGRLVARTLPDGGRILETITDTVGRPQTRFDAFGNALNSEYDANGRLSAVVDAQGNRTSFEYGENGRRVSVRNAAGGVLRNEYDSAGRQTAAVLPDGSRTTASYNTDGNLTSETDYNNITAVYEYDTRNRITAVRYSNGEYVELTYTLTGQLATTRDQAGQTSYSYDLNDRLIATVQPDGQSVQYAYDAAGNRIRVATAGNTTNYTYDPNGRITSVTDGSGATTSYTYDPNGRLVRTDLPDGTSESRTLDLLGRVSVMEVTGPAGVLQRLEYTYDASGRETGIRELNGRETQYAYDNVGRLIRESVTDPASGSTSIGYTYDAMGNRLTRTHSATGTTRYTYDANDRLLTEVTAGVTTRYTYDTAGNLTLVDAGPAEQTQYTYDARGRLIAVAVTHLGIVSNIQYGYDALGHRISRTFDGVTTRLVIDTNRRDSQVLTESTPAGTVTARYVYGDRLISQAQGNLTEYHHADAIGSVRLLTAAGAVVARLTYDAFGETLAQTGTANTSYRFAGQRRDPSTGLYDLRARQYDPRVGRFTSPDPVAGSPQDPTTFNGYIYARNNPVQYVDPSGQTNLLELTVNFVLRNSILAAAATGALFSIADAYLHGDLQGGKADVTVFGVRIPGVVVRGTTGAVLGAAGARFLPAIFTAAPILLRPTLFAGSILGLGSAASAAKDGHVGSAIFRSIFAIIPGLLATPRFLQILESLPGIQGAISTSEEVAGVALVKTEAGEAIVFRADTRDPSIVLGSSMTAKGSNLNLGRHVVGGAYLEESGYVSSTLSREVATNIAKKLNSEWVYYLIPRNGGRLVNQILGSSSPYSQQVELAILGEVPAADIMGAYNIFTKEFIPNPGFAFAPAVP